jgi:hypothetical protein
MHYDTSRNGGFVVYVRDFLAIFTLGGKGYQLFFTKWMFQQL